MSCVVPMRDSARVRTARAAWSHRGGLLVRPVSSIPARGRTEPRAWHADARPRWAHYTRSRPAAGRQQVIASSCAVSSPARSRAGYEMCLWTARLGEANTALRRRNPDRSQSAPPPRAQLEGWSGRHVAAADLPAAGRLGGRGVVWRRLSWPPEGGECAATGKEAVSGARPGRESRSGGESRPAPTPGWGGWAGRATS